MRVVLRSKNGLGGELMSCFELGLADRITDRLSSECTNIVLLLL